MSKLIRGLKRKHDGEFTHFRVDRMADIKILEVKCKNISEVNGNKEFNIAKYSKQIFSMFSGESENIQILFHNSLINVIIDQFGEDVFICKRDEEYFTVTATVAISTAFMAWLFQFGDKAQILSPKNLANEMRLMAEKVARTNASI